MNENIQCLEASAFTIPTELPDSDGTAEWSATTLILVRLGAGGISALGYSYSHEACVPIIKKTLFPLLSGKSPFALRAHWTGMNLAVRNFGREGVASSAIAAVDAALWDLKARLLDLPVVTVLGPVREKVPAYGSGGFTSFSEEKLCQQLETWTEEGLSMVKMKVGRNPDKDPARVAAARRVIGEGVQLFVDANGAHSPKEALARARIFSEQNVSWFEEPVSSDDLAGMNFVRERADMDIAAGEYNYNVLQARAMLEARAVDVLQGDATRCGVTGFLEMAALCDAFGIPFSSHTAPALHAHLGCASSRLRHIEYFSDHVRVEQLLFDGATTRQNGGFVQPDLARPGFGLEFKAQDAARFKVL